MSESIQNHIAAISLRTNKQLAIEVTHAVCPHGYTSCTDNIADIYNALPNVPFNPDLIEQAAYGKFTNLFAHKQGNYLTTTLPSNVSRSTAFQLHRLHLHAHPFYIPRSIYAPLSHNKLLFDCGPLANLLPDHQLSSSSLAAWHYSLEKQLKNPSVVHKAVTRTEETKWYGDTDTFLDIVTTHNAIVGKSGDVWTAANEQFAPLERCGWGIFETSPQKYGFPVDARHPFRVMNHTSVLNVAQSKGYYHWIVEVLPQLTLFIDQLQQDEHLIVHVSEPGTRYVRSMLNLLLGNKTSKRINVEAPSFALRMVIPQSSPCLFARRVTSIITSNVLREKIGSMLDGKKEEGYASILLVRRDPRHKRYLRNYDAMYEALVDMCEYGNYKCMIDAFDASSKDAGRLAMEYYAKQFYKADIVLGLFGAGMTNIVFSAPGTAVIVMNNADPNSFNFDKNSRMYLHHSAALGMRFYGMTIFNWRVNLTILTDVLSLYLPSST